MWNAAWPRLYLTSGGGFPSNHSRPAVTSLASDHTHIRLQRACRSQKVTSSEAVLESSGDRTEGRGGEGRDVEELMWGHSDRRHVRGRRDSLSACHGYVVITGGIPGTPAVGDATLRGIDSWEHQGSLFDPYYSVGLSLLTLSPYTYTRTNRYNRYHCHQ